MSLYVLADFHLSFGCNKPMDVFGGAWSNYSEKLRSGLQVLKPEDTLMIPGDFCWAMDYETAKPDFDFLESFPGRKILLKGNHDYFWTTAAKFRRFCEEQKYEDLLFLHNNCYFYEDIALCGTRGWFYEEDKSGTHDEKVFRRELMRLETSLKAAGEAQKYVFLHYPPIYRGYECPEILEMLHDYHVPRCYYGHLHSESHKLAVTGVVDGIEYHLVSADYLGFRPLKIL